MEALIDIVDCYASPFGSFIWMYNEDKFLHVLLKFGMDKIVMQEVWYHILGGLSTRLHQKNKKEHWPTLLLQIWLYGIQNLNHADSKIEEFQNFTFGPKIFNLYDPHCFVKDHYAIVQFFWIHEACHWALEDPWRYFHSISRPNELVSIAME